MKTHEIMSIVHTIRNESGFRVFNILFLRTPMATGSQTVNKKPQRTKGTWNFDHPQISSVHLEP